MKTRQISLAAFILWSVNANAQFDPAQSANATAVGRGEATAYSVSERGPHHKVWERFEYEAAPDGKQIARRHSYEELVTGMHYKNDKGEWEESEAKIDLLPNNAGASASKGQHKAIFPPELKAGIIELQTPDGQWLRSRVWGVAYFDASSGESVLLAEVKESEGQLTGDNVVNYPDAFTDVQADVRYTYTRAGFEQDVVLREQPPTPEEFNLNPKTTRLQVLTEFVEAGTPAKQSRQAGGLADVTLGFGEMNIGAGKAFSVDAAGANTGHVPVAKQWERIEGRDFLIEEVLHEKVANQLQKLPEAQTYEGASLNRRGQGDTALAGLKRMMPKRYAKAVPQPTDKPKRLAKASPRSTPSFVMDYITLVNQTNQTFMGDTTYLVSDTVNLSGTTTIEGNTVVKFAKTNIAQININDPQLVLRTDAYRPAVFTAKDDNSVGQALGSGSPSGYYGGGVYFGGALLGANPVLSNLRFCYLKTALTLGYDDGQTFAVANTQFLKSDNALYLTGTLNIRNALFNEVGCAFAGSESETAWYGEHLTVNRCGNFVNTSKPTLYLTNSLLVLVTNLEGSEVVTPFWFTNQIPLLTSDAGVFQTVGGGAHYLAANSPYRDVGITNTTEEMLAILKKKTTYPPIAYTNITFTSPISFNPQAQRDIDTPDLGYHYDPLDYSFGGCHANSNITFTAGTAVGWFRASSAYRSTHGIHLGDKKTGLFDGSATSPCYWVRLNTVQENDRTAGSGTGGLTGWANGVANAPDIRIRFTRFSMMSYDGNHCRDDFGWLNLHAQDSEFYGGGIGGYVISMYFTNCLFSRVYVAQVDGNGPCGVVLRNCTMIGNLLQFWPSSAYLPTFKVWDCIFDGTSFQFTATAANSTYAAYDYNSYTNATRPFPTGIGGTHDVVVPSGFNWQTNWLGNFYLPTNSTLINTGSVSAASIYLYHFTTQTNQSKETNSTVDIGYHYVAVNSSGLPIDTDGEGVPDYQEDADGSGTVNSGETDWNNASDLGLKVWITRPKNNSVIP